MTDFTGRTATLLAAGYLTGGTTGGSGGAVLYYRNRVYDSVAVKFVYWATTAPDSTGTSYPGPGTFGVTTTNYTVVNTFTV